MNNDKKFCEFCGNEVYIDAVMCPKCGRQLEELKSDADKKSSNPQIIINNNNQNNNQVIGGNFRKCDKWVAFLLCFFLGYFGAHKFYEGKTGTGILYLLTFGLCGIGWIIDTIVILCKPDPYYV